MSASPKPTKSARVPALAALLLAALLALFTLTACDTDEELTIYTQISERIVDGDSLLYATVFVETKTSSLLGTEEIDQAADATVTVNGAQLTFSSTLGAFQRAYGNLEGDVEIVVDKNGTHRHTINLERVVVSGMPEVEDSPIEPFFIVTWTSSNEAIEGTVELFQFTTESYDDYIYGTSPIEVAVPNQYLTDSLRVVFYYAESLGKSSPFEESTYYFTQQNDVFVGD
ncbi:hypothetical protein KQI52_15615 [bacterium]|nr:hypothetical protein [bacterium]